MKKEFTYKTDVVTLQKIALEQGLKTKSAIAERCNIDRNTLGKILNGKEQPSSSVMYKLVEGLHIAPAKAGSIFFKRNLRIA